MRLVYTPEPLAPVLEPMEPVDIEIVGHEREHDLPDDRPVGDDPHPRQRCCVVDPSDQTEDQIAEQIALQDRVHPEIVPEPRAEEALLLVIGEPALEYYEQEREGDDEDGGEVVEGHGYRGLDVWEVWEVGEISPQRHREHRD